MEEKGLVNADHLKNLWRWVGVTDYTDVTVAMKYFGGNSGGGLDDLSQPGTEQVFFFEIYILTFQFIPIYTKGAQ